MNYTLLNLIKPEYSDIPYHIDNFPDGEKHLVLEGNSWNKHKYVNILTRIASMDDLFILLQADKIFRHENVIVSTIRIIYLLGARCDRRFSLGEAIDRDIIFYLLPACDHLEILDPHSLDKSFTEAYPIFAVTNYFNFTDYNICFPDRGAFDRLSKIIPTISIMGNKKRSESGISIELNVVNTINTSKPILVIDDLCDAGGTFIVLANKLQEDHPSIKKHIFVTHAIQKKGVVAMAMNYDQVYITNSYKDWDKEELPDNVTVIDICSKL